MKSLQLPSVLNVAIAGGSGGGDAGGGNAGGDGTAESTASPSLQHIMGNALPTAQVQAPTRMRRDAHAANQVRVDRAELALSDETRRQ